MEDQGGSGGVPLHDEGPEAEHRKPHTGPARTPGTTGEKDEGTRAADTDEASRLDPPERQDPADPRRNRVRWDSPHGDD